jgi:hypothetical protein
MLVHLYLSGFLFAAVLFEDSRLARPLMLVLDGLSVIAGV